MDRYALLAWLLELIQGAPEVDRTRTAPAPDGRFEAIEIVWRDHVWLIRVDEVAS